MPTGKDEPRYWEMFKRDAQRDSFEDQDCLTNPINKNKTLISGVIKSSFVFAENHYYFCTNKYLRRFNFNYDNFVSDWTFPFNNVQNSDFVFSTPLFISGKQNMSDEIADKYLFVGTTKGHIYCFRIDNQNPTPVLWMFEKIDSIVSSPVYAKINGQYFIFFASKALNNSRGKIYKFLHPDNCSYNGNPPHSFQMYGKHFELPDGAGFQSSPAIYTTSNGDVRMIIGSDNGYLYEIDLDSMTILSQFGFPPYKPVVSSPLIVNKKVFIGINKNLCCFVLDSGLGLSNSTLINSITTGNLIKSSPVSCSRIGEVYCGSYDRKVYCVNEDDTNGIPKWVSQQLAGPILSTPCVCLQESQYNSFLGRFFVSAKNKLYSFNPLSSTPQIPKCIYTGNTWTENMLVSSPIIGNGLLIANSLHSINSRSFVLMFHS